MTERKLRHGVEHVPPRAMRRWWNGLVAGIALLAWALVSTDLSPLGLVLLFLAAAALGWWLLLWIELNRDKDAA